MRGEVVMTTGMELIEKGKKEGYEQGIAQGIEKGIEKGIEQGIEQAKRDDARKMLADGMHTTLIEKYTGLAREIIEALRD